jgi:hypothetical protein
MKTSRPDHRHPRVRELAEPEIAEALARANGEGTEDNFDEEIKSIIENNETDLYRFAKNMEEYPLNWYVTGDMLDEFEVIIHAIDRAVEKAEEEWWAERPTLNLDLDLGPAIGATVSFQGRYNHETKAYDRITGEVTAVDKRGRATVFCASLGHVRTGLGTHGRIIPVEDLRGE